jgi:hypothetical protein
MKQIALLLIISLLTSCAMSMSLDSFQKEVRRASGKSKVFERDILYKGTDSEYHYFYIKTDLGIPKSVKLKKEELVLSEEFEYTDDSEKWLSYSSVK